MRQPSTASRRLTCVKAARGAALTLNSGNMRRRGAVRMRIVHAKGNGSLIMHIGRISTQPVESCTAECSAFELADRMRHAHVGDIVVIEYRNGEAIPIGLVTDRDLVIEVMARGDDPGDVTAGQIMSRGLVVVSDTDEIGVALEEMRRSGIRRLPVVDDAGRLAGIVTLDDIVEHLAGLLGGVVEVGKLQQIEEQRFRA